jgi:hypothetical protein
LTRVAPTAHVEAPKRSGSRPALGVAAGVFALVLVGVGVYSLTGGFKGAAVEEVKPQTLQQTQAAPTAEPSPAETRQAETPAPEPEATPDAPRRVAPVTTTAKGSKPRAADAQPQGPPPPHVHQPAAPLPEPDAAADPAQHPALPGAGIRRPLTREEAQEMLRRVKEQRLRARQLRQQRIREQQRRQGYEPPPPPRRPR